jgi:hypothetical protein
MSTVVWLAVYVVAGRAVIGTHRGGRLGRPAGHGPPVAGAPHDGEPPHRGPARRRPRGR